MESGEDGTDPAMRASKMSLEDVRKELATEECWVEGVDWIQRKRDREEASSNSASSGSNATSPVLSTTTLGTTPSPPPPTEEDEKEKEVVPSSQATVTEERPRRLTIPIAPVLDPPRLLTMIPWIPTTLNHMPNYSFEALKMVRV